MAVVYVEVSNLEKFNQEILKIEEKLKITTFHWGEERWEVRNKFLAQIMKLDFEVKVAVFENPANPEKMMDLVFLHLITEVNINTVFIDGKKPRWYELSLKKRLRNKGVSVKKLRTVNDKNQPGIQVADCLAGLIRRYYDTPGEEYPSKWLARLKDGKKLRLQLLFQ